MNHKITAAAIVLFLRVSTAVLPAETATSAAATDLGFDRLVFVKRYTYNANHYYTEYINSKWMPGGNLCILNLKDGAVREIVQDLKGGVFERFDLSFDARRIVFAWKGHSQQGYRIYEVNVDGTGLRQLTFPPPDEEELIRKYRVDGNYHHGTDDMQPCYLPDGGIAFISTRCQYGILWRTCGDSSREGECAVGFDKGIELLTHGPGPPVAAGVSPWGGRGIDDLEGAAVGTGERLMVFELPGAGSE